jgi:ribosomal protein L10
MANIPSRDELLSKLVWLFNYPVQSLTSVLDQIAKKKEEGGDAVIAEPKVEEVKEEKVEEPKADKAAE